MSAFTISLIPVLSDNYTYLIHDGSQAIIVDPAQASPVLEVVREKGLTIRHILNTHHHDDHIEGNEEIKASTGCLLWAPEDPRIAGVDHILAPGETVNIDSLSFDVIPTPAHTSTHIALYTPQLGAVFSGDSLFAGGCGRLFEGTAEEMWESLQRLARLPDSTLVYCGHEYTESNLRFALTVDPENTELQERVSKVHQMREKGLPTIPSTIAEEKKTNPFLRVQDLQVRQSLDMKEASDIEVFAKIRALKDQF